ncbi:MAG: glucose-1-phosphate adenylyltransferase subunit GlgD [Acholeplasmataceae bacterium]|nr:glucose-1-phosphate adenylyltransferase subunit GlgD [Acholeplasmataceae bacterium]
MKTLALILAGGQGTRLDLLSQRRSKPAVPFAGKYRIIDFSLSNASNSGIYDIAILTQYLPFSLNEHIGSGKPWDLDRRDSSVTLLQPHNDWYMGTADAVLKNIDFVIRARSKYVLILSGDHIFKMDFRKLIAEHEKNNAELTIATKVVPFKDVSRFGILETDENGFVKEFVEKPKTSKSNLASMGIYLFNSDVLVNSLLSQSKKYPNLDFGHHIIPYLIYEKKAVVSTFKFYGYWQDVGTYDSYLTTNLELNQPTLELDLYDPTWPIFTKNEGLPPVKFGDKAEVRNSLISNGSIVYGTVINSVISPGVLIQNGAIVKDSVILNDCIIGENVEVNSSILDKKVVVGRNTIIGYGDDYTANLEKPDVLNKGINVVEKSTLIDSDLIIERNCRILRNATFDTKVIKSGSTVK